MTKALQNQKPLQKSYESALDNVLGKDTDVGTRNLYKKREKAKAMNSIEGLALLAESFSDEDYREVFASSQFAKMLRSVLGMTVIDDEEKRLKEIISDAKTRISRLEGKYQKKNVQIMNEQGIHENELYLIKNSEERQQKLREAGENYQKKQRDLSREHTDNCREVEDTVRETETALKQLRMAFNRMRTGIAVTIGNTAIECCIKQYSQIETIGILAQPGIEFLERAVKFMSGIAEKVKETT